ncbi:hypothetical protein ACFLT7_04945 [candidate division KSB1 bacterium]
MNKSWLAIAFLCLGISNCGESPFELNTTQGVWGQAAFYEGNFQPKTPSGIMTYVKRTVYFFELTNMSDNVEVFPDFAPESGIFYSKINSKLIGCARSDDQGLFQKSLPVGDYSVFVLERGYYYFNTTDGVNNIAPVRV